MNGLVLVTCGGAKLDHPAPARDLYTGSYFQLCKAAAEALNPSRGWLILSAMHGLTDPATILDPYNLRMGQPGSVTPARIRHQADELGISGVTLVVVLAGLAYTQIARTVWPALIAPLQGHGGMGYQMAYLSTVVRTGSL